MNGDNVVCMQDYEEDQGLPDTVTTFPYQEPAIARHTPQSAVSGLSGLGDDNLLSFGGAWNAVKSSWKPLLIGGIIGGVAVYLEGRYGYIRDLLKI